MANDNRARITELQQELSLCENRIVALQNQIQGYESQLGTIQSNHSSAQSLKNNIQELKNTADSLLGQIEVTKNESIQSKDQIESLATSAEESQKTFETQKSNLEAIETKIAEFEKQIVEQLGRAASWALAIAFDDRLAKIEIELERWRKNLYITTLILLLLGIVFFIYSFWAKFDYQFLLKLSVTFPVIYAVWFSWRQYEKERSISEQYAFKAAKAKSLAAFSKTVKEIDDSDWINEVDGGKQRTQKFVISSIEKIYTSPALDIKSAEFPLDKVLETAKNIVNLK